MHYNLAVIYHIFLWHTFTSELTKSWWRILEEHLVFIKEYDTHFPIFIFFILFFWMFVHEDPVMNEESLSYTELLRFLVLTVLLA